MLISLGIALSAVAVDDLLGSVERAYRKQRLMDRTDHTLSAIYQLFYSDTGMPQNLVQDSWKEVAVILRVAPGRMRPADTLVGVMGYHKKFRGSRSDVEILLKTVQLRLEDGSYVPPRKIRTIDDVIRCLVAVRLQRCMLGTGISQPALTA